MLSDINSSIIALRGFNLLVRSMCRNSDLLNFDLRKQEAHVKALNTKPCSEFVAIFFKIFY